MNPESRVGRAASFSAARVAHHPLLFDNAYPPKGAGNDLPSKLIVANHPPLAIIDRRSNLHITDATVVCAGFNEFAGFADVDGGSGPKESDK